MFRLLVESWRKNWGDAELPFYFVQLSSIDRPSWTWFRDSQRRLMAEIPHTGMAVSSDRGDSLDVHPKQKREVGERLAAWALNKTYGYKMSFLRDRFINRSYLVEVRLIFLLIMRRGCPLRMGNRFVHSKWQVMMDYFIRHRLLLKTVK